MTIVLLTGQTCFILQNDGYLNDGIKKRPLILITDYIVILTKIAHVLLFENDVIIFYDCANILCFFWEDDEIESPIQFCGCLRWKY